MALILSTIMRNTIGDAMASLMNVGSLNPNGYIELRTGPKPTNPQFVATGTLLATLQLSNPVYNAFSNGIGIANTITGDSNIDASGVCAWFRVYNRDGTAMFDGVVTISGGGGDIELPSVNFVQGGTVELSEFTLQIPNT